MLKNRHLWFDHLTDMHTQTDEPKGPVTRNNMLWGTEDTWNPHTPNSSLPRWSRDHGWTRISAFLSPCKVPMQHPCYSYFHTLWIWNRQTIMTLDGHKLRLQLLPWVIPVKQTCYRSFSKISAHTLQIATFHDSCHLLAVLYSVMLPF